jgi:hypothetical protein
VKNATSWPNYRNAAKNVVFRRHGNVIENDDYRKAGIALCVSLLRRRQ